MFKKSLFLAIVITALAGMGFMAFAPASPQDIVVNETKREIVIAEPEHDFGTIKENEGPVSFVFIFTNISDEDITVATVEASCGCTVATFTKEPVAPGKVGEITVTYNPKGRPLGAFTKSATATTNKGQKVRVRIKGIVE